MPAETQLREDLADAMRESPRDSGELIKLCIFLIKMEFLWAWVKSHRLLKLC